MDEQRIQAYVELIQALLNCPNGQEAEILQQHQELVDVGLLPVMALLAMQLQENGQTNAANWLVQQATQLATVLGMELPTAEMAENAPPSQESVLFVAELLQCVAEHRGNPQEVYPFFQANLARLNGELLRVLPLVVTRLFEGKSSEEQQFIAAVVVDFGNRIQQFPLGNRSLNLELAIAAYEQALLEYTRSAFPQQWAMTQNNLANAYSDRITGDRAGNLEQAIHHYEQALLEYTRSAFPQDWAGTQNNLANAYRNRITGDRAGNLERAIHHYEQALLEDTVDTLPATCLIASRSLGNLHFTAGNWHDAASAYETALAANDRLRTWAAHEDRRQAIQNEVAGVYANLVQCYVNLGNHGKALETVERSRSKRLVELMTSHDLYADGNIPPEIQTLLEQIDTCQSQIDGLRGFGKAGETLGAKHLGDNSSASPQIYSPNASPAFARRGRIALAAATEAIHALEAEKQRLRQQLSQLDPVSAGLLQVSAPNLAALQSLLTQPTTALLSFYTTPKATYIFILRQTSDGEVVTHCHTCPDQTIDTLQNWLIENWLRPYAEINAAETEAERTTRYLAWANAIPEVLAQLSQRLDFPTLIQQYLQGIDELILVSHLLLHQIPFAALPIGSQYLSDLFHLRQVPNTQVLEFCHNRPPLDPSHYGTVEDATDDLPCANFEGERVAQLLNIPPENRLRGSREATVSRYRHLIAQTHSLLSSHHAQSRLDSPLESALLLADGTITLGQLLSPGWRLPHLGDVFLSCCETGLGFSPETIDEPLSLATGFLCAGARNVVSTLWSVDDLATSLFTIRYYHHRQTLNRPAALQAAQRDLRTLTGKALKRDYYQELNAILDKRYDEATANLETAKKRHQQFPNDETLKRDYDRWAKAATKIDKAQDRLKQLCKEDFPFAHPVYWSGFVSQGVR